jgi:hypothetical protein
VALADADVLADYNSEKSFFTPATGQPTIEGATYDAAAGSFSFSWTAAAGASYEVDVSTNLPSFTPLATGLQTNSFTDVVPAGPMRFYRLRVEQPPE